MLLALFQFSLGTSITENTSEIVPKNARYFDGHGTCNLCFVVLDRAASWHTYLWHVWDHGPFTRCASIFATVYFMLLVCKIQSIATRNKND